MAGSGGYKQRKRRLERKRNQTESKARENIRRVRVQFEQKGQTWDPRSDGIQLAHRPADLGVESVHRSSTSSRRLAFASSRSAVRTDTPSSAAASTTGKSCQ